MYPRYVEFIEHLAHYGPFQIPFGQAFSTNLDTTFEQWTFRVHASDVPSAQQILLVYLRRIIGLQFLCINGRQVHLTQAAVSSAYHRHIIGPLSCMSEPMSFMYQNNLMYHRCIVGVSSTYHRCIVGVSSVYHRRSQGRSQVCW